MGYTTLCGCIEVHWYSLNDFHAYLRAYKCVHTYMEFIYIHEYVSGHRYEARASPLVQSWEKMGVLSFLYPFVLSLKKVRVPWSKHRQEQTCFFHTLESESPHLYPWAWVLYVCSCVHISLCVCRVRRGRSPSVASLMKGFQILCYDRVMCLECKGTFTNPKEIGK